MEFNNLFSIGDMAKLFHLSVGSLRHYEEIGLLQPEWVDPNSGYRYYSARQFEPLNTIRYLRALDMPLGEIADFMQNKDDHGLLEEEEFDPDLILNTDPKKFRDFIGYSS